MVEGLAPKLSREEELFAITLGDAAENLVGKEWADLLRGDVFPDATSAVQLLAVLASSLPEGINSNQAFNVPLDRLRAAMRTNEAKTPDEQQNVLQDVADFSKSLDETEKEVLDQTLQELLDRLRPLLVDRVSILLGEKVGEAARRLTSQPLPKLDSLPSRSEIVDQLKQKRQETLESREEFVDRLKQKRRERKENIQQKLTERKEKIQQKWTERKEKREEQTQKIKQTIEEQKQKIQEKLQGKLVPQKTQEQPQAEEQQHETEQEQKTEKEEEEQTTEKKESTLETDPNQSALKQELPSSENAEFEIERPETLAIVVKDADAQKTEEKPDDFIDV